MSGGIWVPRYVCVCVGCAYACVFLLWALLKVSASVFLIPASSHSSILTASFVVTSVYGNAQIPAHHACDKVRVRLRVWLRLSMPNCQWTNTPVLKQGVCILFCEARTHYFGFYMFKILPWKSEFALPYLQVKVNALTRCINKFFFWFQNWLNNLNSCLNLKLEIPIVLL